MAHDHEHPHDHDHDHAAGAHGAATEQSARRLGLSLAVTAGIMVAEAVGGIVSGSLALVSDAGHMLTDVAALGLALLAVRFASRPADQKRTFGFHRAEVLAAQANVAALVVLTAWIAWEAVDRLRNPGARIELGVMAAVAAVGLLANLFVLRWLHADHSLNARSAFLHVLGDAVSSVVVLAGAAAMWFEPSWTWIDPVLSLAISLLILWGALRLSLEIADILMEAVPRHLAIDEVCGAMGGIPGVLAVHDLHVWTISSGHHALSAHVVVGEEDLGRNDAILDQVKGRLRERFGIDHTTIQIESARYAHLYDDVHVHGHAQENRCAPHAAGG
ncbi:MAG: cation diffusion facilitator family transporter [Anaeromyxobacteraceae bacterium]|jgi:cobalt-zinc-cadmium efflux system protein|nr:cation diffusion facilitator family transporter [Anaeromyxobacteraceae bacterium]